jgi:hypothetical protein
MNRTAWSVNLSQHAAVNHRNWVGAWGGGGQDRNKNAHRRAQSVMACYCSLRWMRSALFWDFTQRGKVIPYRRFGTTYHPVFKDQSYYLALDDGTETLSRNVDKELPFDIA